MLAGLLEASVTAQPTVGVLYDALVRWLSGRRQAVLVMLRADGSPQSSNVAVVFRGSTGYVSVTATRAMTRNLRRDPRAVLHVLGGSFGQYAAPVRGIRRMPSGIRRRSLSLPPRSGTHYDPSGSPPTALRGSSRWAGRRRGHQPGTARR